MNHFAFSAYFAGLLFLCVPLLLHFLRKKPVEIRNFPSFFFLRETALLRQRRNSLLKYLVLFCRCGAICCLCAGFAWPYAAGFEQEPESATVILVDGSFSTDSPANRERMRKLLAEELEKISPSSPVLGGVVGGRVTWSGTFTGSREELELFFKRMKFSASGSDFRSALLLADRRLGTVNARRRRIIVITDRQKYPWRNLPSSPFLHYADEWKLLPSAVSEPAGNLALLAAEWKTEEKKLIVRIRSFLPQTAPYRLTVFLNGRAAGEFSGLAEGNSEHLRSCVLNYDASEFSGPVGGQVILSSERDEIKADSIRYFVWNPSVPPEIFITRGKGFDFTAAALHTPSLKLRELSADSPGDAERAGLIVIRDASALGENGSDTLKKLLANGVGAVVMFDNSAEMKRLLKPFGIGMRPGGKAASGSLEMVNFTHPVFRSALGLSVAPWFDVSFTGIFRMTFPPHAKVLASFPDDLPAVVELAEGRGRLFVLSFTYGDTNFQTSGMFLPFWRELAEYCMMRRMESCDETVSPEPLSVRGGLLDRSEPGCFPVNGTLYSVNVDGAESDTQLLPASFSGGGLILPHRADSRGSILRKQLAERKDYTRLMLLLLLIFATLELAISNRTVH